MSNIDLTDTLLTIQKHRPRILGRFSTSDVWAIRNGYLTPENYFKEEVKDFSQAFKMWNGTWRHNQVQELLKELGYEIELKIEHKTPDFTLVGKIDAIKDDIILEIKTSTELLPKAKSWHIEQLKIYLSLFEKEKGVIVQPITQGNKLILKEIGIVKRDNKFFEKVLTDLREFQTKLK